MPSSDKKIAANSSNQAAPTKAASLTNKWGVRLTEEQVAIALQKTGGVKADAAYLLALTIKKLCQWVNRSPKLQEIILKAIDKNAEANIDRAIRNGDPKTIRWFKERFDPLADGVGESATIALNPAYEKLLREINERIAQEHPELLPQQGTTSTFVDMRSELADDNVARAIRAGDLKATRWYKERTDPQYPPHPRKEDEDIFPDKPGPVVMNHVYLEMRRIVDERFKKGLPPLFPVVPSLKGLNARPLGQDCQKERTDASPDRSVSYEKRGRQ